ncbi:MAG TPA: EF-hand domain-containing protein [Albitalea sp.]|uniref:EF-hand domain-containing protein n=1 Tax=Piscinibacter sp. TaxID=1903157 RepID=UPI002ED03546
MNRWHLTLALGLGGLAAFAFAAGSKGGADAEFSMMDSNHDGKVSADEHAAGAKRMFDTMDADHDGKVTAAEMDAAHERISGRKARKGDMSAADKIKVVDRNGDGVLTAEEHAAGSKAMFERMDTDHDGALSKAEFTKGHARMLEKPGG